MQAMVSKYNAYEEEVSVSSDHSPLLALEYICRTDRIAVNSDISSFQDKAKLDASNLDLNRISNTSFHVPVTVTGSGPTPHIFATSMPVVTAEVCNHVVEVTEAHVAASGAGWSTSRHYSVPTTDVPIHEVPVLLHWFNALMRDSVGPLLRLQFPGTMRTSGDVKGSVFGPQQLS